MFADELEVLEYRHRIRPAEDSWDVVAACPICGQTENCDCDSRPVGATAETRYED